MTRQRPYRTNQITWKTLIDKHLRIPMNQREYSWTVNEITPFLNDIFYIFEENKYVEKMGSIINLEYEGYNDIYDGQQRILTVMLILKVIGGLSPILKERINALISKDILVDDLTIEENNIKNKCKEGIIPKIHCINPYDNNGLVKIFNNEVESWFEYIDNVNDYEYNVDFNDKNKKFKCKKCGSNTTRKDDFIRHISDKHGYIVPCKKTKINDAYIEITNYFKLKKYDGHNLIKLYKFITEDIDIEFYTCTDPVYVSRIFDWENNRGKTVQSLDVMKNQILVSIPDDKKFEIYDRWETLKHSEHKIYKKSYGQKIFDIAIQIYNGIIQREVNHDELYKTIITSKDTYTDIKSFFRIVEDLIEIHEDIGNDRFGGIINNCSRVCLTWEAYMYLLLPIFYKLKHNDEKNNNYTKIFSKLMELMAKWYFRNMQFNNRTFNNLCYSNDFIKITNKCLKNTDSDCYIEIEECLKKHKNDNINVEEYKKSMKTMSFKSTNATYLLLFLETCKSTDIHRVSYDFTLEHIIPQSNVENLVNKSLMHNIGNLTLLEGKNSTNGHKGNSALSNKEYKVKRNSYRDSSSKITNCISTDYEDFKEEHIVQRNIKLVDDLNNYTNY